eukprot:jgi/Mesen1/1122/ME000123S00301
MMVCVLVTNVSLIVAPTSFCRNFWARPEIPRKRPLACWDAQGRRLPKKAEQQLKKRQAAGECRASSDDHGPPDAGATEGSSSSGGGSGGNTPPLFDRARPVDSAAWQGGRRRHAGGGMGILRERLQRANAYMPHVIAASTALALVYPPSFAWFRTPFYAPALGFLMFAVGINLSVNDFGRALEQPAAIAAGYVAQFTVKPVLGALLAAFLVPLLGLPPSIGTGLMLVGSVSGAQLSNYATFMVDPPMAPLR